MNLTELSKQIHEGNKKKGFYEKERGIPELLCLIHSEVSEALEADRKGRSMTLKTSTAKGRVIIDNDDSFKGKFESNVKDTFEDEIADTMIRLFDLAGYLNIDLDFHVEAKLRYNSLRDHKHGKKY